MTAKYQSIDETLISQTHVFGTTNFVGFCPEFGKGHVGFALSVAQDCLQANAFS